MLSTEKAKLRSAFDNTNSQMHSDKILKAKLTHTRGIIINLIINCSILMIFAEMEALREFIADFKKSWFMVSQILVRSIKSNIRNKPCFII